MHLSMRIPWRDRPWDDLVCEHPAENSSCILLRNIGPNRDDVYEASIAGQPIPFEKENPLPCISERATFMSSRPYSVTKVHPYANHRALKGTLHPSDVVVPAHAFEAIPFRWLSRKSLADDIGHGLVPNFSLSAESKVDETLGSKPSWIMDGDNQRAVIDSFFDPVVVADSLVFVYLKHSPLQEERTDRLLVGAARITGITPPPMWDQTGSPPFGSCMWETKVEHSLRSEMHDGVLLPYQALTQLQGEGVDVSDALAWAPEGRDIEFSYVTEHVSDDAALDALGSLARAFEAAVALGIDMPMSAREWIIAQSARIWQQRGPAPGLASVLNYLGVENSYGAARCVLSEVPAGESPWELLEKGFSNRRHFNSQIESHIHPSASKIWSKLASEEKSALKLLSAMDISPGQVEILMNGDTDVYLELSELLENPYFAAICTNGATDHIPFTTVDKACFPAPHVKWRDALPIECRVEDALDGRRVEALLADVLEMYGREGDTLVPQDEAIERANTYALTRPPVLNERTLRGLELDCASLQLIDRWTSVIGVQLADGKPALKLRRFEDTSNIIRDWIGDQRSQARSPMLENARLILDEALHSNSTVTDGVVDSDEESARREKAAGLNELYQSPISVLIGSAGTGKTTLIKALADLPEVSQGRIVLLAPTGKARVQLQSKVGREAQTLASFLTRTERYDPESGRYQVWGDDQPRTSAALVVIDEASMLTEEMLAATLDAFGNVRRLVLVGDPQQLPPIGGGRPFVDLVRDLGGDDPSIGDHPGFVKLVVTRRQTSGGQAGTSRNDLELAAWFREGDPPAGSDEIWDVLRGGGDGETLVYRQWNGSSLIPALIDSLEEELDWTGDADPERAFALTYGGSINGKYLNWEPGAGERAEDWQILSPHRTRASGTVEINRLIKSKYRENDTRWADKRGSWNVPLPLGPERIVRGDKVMQTRNKRIAAYPQGAGLDYVANGEIGVAIGKLTSASKATKNKLTLKIEFSSQAGAQYSYWTGNMDDPLLELAWAVTIHKSQGSEFGITFLILPARMNASRELIYTALTRQKNKVVILHEGTVDGFRDLSQPWASETSRRLTDLFQLPESITLKVADRQVRFDAGHMHITADGKAVASKNEVIIAAILDELVPGDWEYEMPFIGSDGRQVLPDFTINLPDGRTVYWEHAGMLDVPTYARKWSLKQKWYAENGIASHGDGGGASGTLLVTDDRHGVDVPEWTKLAKEAFGLSQSNLRAGRKDERPPAKKSIRPRPKRSPS